jgi:hypothetical protein
MGCTDQEKRTSFKTPYSSRAKYGSKKEGRKIRKLYPHLTPAEITELMDSTTNVMMLASPHKHTNSNHQPHPLNQGLSTLPTKGLGT